MRTLPGATLAVAGAGSILTLGYLGEAGAKPELVITSPGETPPWRDAPLARFEATTPGRGSPIAGEFAIQNAGSADMLATVELTSPSDSVDETRAVLVDSETRETLYDGPVSDATIPPIALAGDEARVIILTLASGTDDPKAEPVMPSVAVDARAAK